MIVNVLCKRPQSDRIVSRLARYLVNEQPNYILSDRPIDNAHIYFGAVHMQGLAQLPLTGLRGAWFSHYGTTRHKQSVFNQANAALHFRTTCVDFSYQHLSEPKTFVTPPLDHKRYFPQGVQKTKTIGMSNIITEKARKWPEAATFLHTWAQSKGMVLDIVGAGWPVTHRYLDGSLMPDWYSQLEVYVSTSQQEGIGYGPLEALACGSKVVVARGVGIVGQFKDQPGVRLFEPMNRTSLFDAIERCLADCTPPVQLTNLVAGFTIEAWHRNHNEFFERLLDDDYSGFRRT